MVEDALVSLVQRGKDGSHPAVVLVSAVEVEVRVIFVRLGLLDPGAVTIHDLEDSSSQ